MCNGFKDLIFKIKQFRHNNIQWTTTKFYYLSHEKIRWSEVYFFNSYRICGWLFYDWYFHFLILTKVSCLHLGPCNRKINEFRTFSNLFLFCFFTQDNISNNSPVINHSLNNKIYLFLCHKDGGLDTINLNPSIVYIMLAFLLK